MNKNVDLEKCEQELFEELLSVILFLNNNGIPLDSVKESPDLNES